MFGKGTECARYWHLWPQWRPSPFRHPRSAQAAGEDSAVVAPKCDRACLLGALARHMDALRKGDISLVPLATNARVVENDVAIPAGTGLWRTVTGVDATGLEAADPLTGNAAWFGSVKENGEPAIYAVRIHVTPAGLIDEIESVVHRKTALPAPFGDVTKMTHDDEFNQVLPTRTAPAARADAGDCRRLFQHRRAQ